MKPTHFISTVQLEFGSYPTAIPEALTTSANELRDNCKWSLRNEGCVAGLPCEDAVETLSELLEWLSV